MKKTTTFAVTLILAVVLCFALASMAQAGPAKKDPIWSIFKNGTTQKVNWKEADNPRFLTYNNGTSGDETDDIVLDQETGLVWMKIPGTTLRTWYEAAYDCIGENAGGRMGYRLPTVEELLSLKDGSGLSLPSGHPFSLIDDSGTQPSYWTSTSDVTNPTIAAYPVCFPPPGSGCLYDALKETSTNYVWCVRGGYGYDSY